MNRTWTRLNPRSVVLWAIVLASSQIAAQTRSPVTALAISNDGNSVAVGSQDGVAILSWPKLERTSQLPSELTSVNQVRFSPSGRKLAVVGGTPGVSGNVDVYSWPTKQLIRRSEIAKDTLTSIVWLDETHLALASLDHQIAIWDSASNKIEKRLRGHSRGVTALTYLKQESILVSGSIDQNLRVWNAKTWELKLTLNNHKNAIHHLALRPTDGLPMITSSSDDGTVRFWQPTIGRLVRFVKLKQVPLAVEWLRDGSQAVAALSNGSIALVNPDDAAVSEPISAVSSWAYTIAVHPNGKQVLVGSRNGQLQIVSLSK